MEKNVDSDQRFLFYDLGGQGQFKSEIGNILGKKPSIIIYTIDSSFYAQNKEFGLEEKTLEYIKNVQDEVKKYFGSQEENPVISKKETLAEKLKGFRIYPLEIYVITKTDLINSEDRMSLEKMLKDNKILSSSIFTSSVNDEGIENLHGYLTLAGFQEGRYTTTKTTKKTINNDYITEEKDVSIIGIFGEGGSGKTTLIQKLQTGIFNSKPELTKVDIKTVEAKYNITI